MNEWDKSLFRPVAQHVSLQKREAVHRMRREMPAAESRLWAALRRNGLRGTHFRRQQAIAGFVADFYCHSARLVVEVDGSSHDGAEEYDADRDRVFERLGLTVLRLSNDAVLQDLGAALDRIASQLDLPAH